MEAYAVVETGGKQYLVKPSDTLKVEKLDAKPGSSVSLGRVLAASDGSKLRIGAPEVAGVAVTSTVVEHTLGDKVLSFKKKRRKGYKRKVGHRQPLTLVRIEKITVG